MVLPFITKLLNDTCFPPHFQEHIEMLRRLYGELPKALMTHQQQENVGAEATIIRIRCFRAGWLRRRHQARCLTARGFFPCSGGVCMKRCGIIQFAFSVVSLSITEDYPKLVISLHILAMVIVAPTPVNPLCIRKLWEKLSMTAASLMLTPTQLHQGTSKKAARAQTSAGVQGQWWRPTARLPFAGWSSLFDRTWLQRSALPLTRAGGRTLLTLWQHCR